MLYNRVRQRAIVCHDHDAQPDGGDSAHGLDGAEIVNIHILLVITTNVQNHIRVLWGRLGQRPLPPFFLVCPREIRGVEHSRGAKRLLSDGIAAVITFIRDDLGVVASHIGHSRCHHVKNTIWHKNNVFWEAKGGLVTLNIIGSTLSMLAFLAPSHIDNGVGNTTKPCHDEEETHPIPQSGAHPPVIFPFLRWLRLCHRLRRCNQNSWRKRLKSNDHTTTRDGFLRVKHLERYKMNQHHARCNHGDAVHVDDHSATAHSTFNILKQSHPKTPPPSAR